MKFHQLAKRVGAEILPKEDGERYLMVYRDWQPDSGRGLRRSTVDQVLKLKALIDTGVPNDFDYWLTFEDGSVGLQIILEDGPHAGAGFPFPGGVGTTALELGVRLKRADWNSIRVGSLNQTNLLDQIADRAEDFEPQWISTADIQAPNMERIDEYVRWLKTAGQLSAVLAADPEAETLMNCTVESPEERDRWISEQMGQGNLILAVVENGVLLSAEETDRIRRVELEVLPRIARAKADGRFWLAMEAMQKEGSWPESFS